MAEEFRQQRERDRRDHEWFVAFQARWVRERGIVISPQKKET